MTDFEKAIELFAHSNWKLIKKENGHDGKILTVYLGNQRCHLGKLIFDFNAVGGFRDCWLEMDDQCVPC